MNTRIDDAEILDWILNGALIIDFETLEVRKFHKNRKTFTKLGRSVHPLSGRIRIVLGDGYRRRTIYRNKLVWMAFHKRMVPDNIMIDHIDRDVTNDLPHNLQLHTELESTTQGYNGQLESFYKNWCAFFEYLEFMGHIPPEDSILWL